MKAKTTETGRTGERLAAEYLQAKGYRVLECNWRYLRYELDLIAEFCETLVFVEVKLRKNSHFGEPEVFVTRAKQARIIAAANHFVESRSISLPSRFDVVAITMAAGAPSIVHLEDAFFPVAS